MPIIVRNLRLNLDAPEERLLALAAKRLKVPNESITSIKPVRRSLDARKHDDIHFVYHAEVNLDGGPRAEEKQVKKLHSPHVALAHLKGYDDPTSGIESLPHPPLIVGFGPAGMFAALRLVQFGFAPIVVERGADVRRRHKDIMHTFYREHVFNPESNLLYGEGGAGTYSDGKLYTRVNDALVPTVLQWLTDFGADPDILTDARPHIGSDRLPTICRRIRLHLESAGGQVLFDHQLKDLTISDGHVTHVDLGGHSTPTGPVILAIGHSARDTMRMLRDNGIPMEARPFQIGVRIEHPQSLVDTWQYGPCAGHPKLPPAEYHVVAKNVTESHRDCYSFCMCPGGVILPTNESPGLIATNGASKSRRNQPFANSGLVVTHPAASGSDPLGGIDVQRRWEQKAYEATGGTYRVPAQRAADFAAGRMSDGELTTSYPLGGAWTDNRQLLPPDVTAAIGKAITILDHRMPGFGGMDALVTAPETRASSPVRVLRDPQHRASPAIDNLYPTGEGAGYAGGIVSAAIDGIKTADAIIRRYAANR